MTTPCTIQRTQRSQSRARFHRIQMNILVVFLWLVEQDWCETIPEQMWGSTSLGRGGAFSELKEQFRSGRTPGCQWGNLADGTLPTKSWYFIDSHRRWSDLVCSRRCLHDHPHQTLEKETLQCTPQFVKSVVKEITKVESSKQNSFTGMLFNDDWQQESLGGSSRVTSRKMLVVDSVKKNSEPSTWPVRKSEKKPEPWCLACTWNLAKMILEE